MNAVAKTVMALVLAGCGPGESAELSEVATKEATPAEATSEEDEKWLPGVFDESWESHRGMNRVWETQRLDRVSIIRRSSDHFGGALGGGFFFMECLGKLCTERGYSYYMHLDVSWIRHGTTAHPGGETEHVIAFLRSRDEDPRAVLPMEFPDDATFDVKPADVEQLMAEQAESPRPVPDDSSHLGRYSIHFRWDIDSVQDVTDADEDR